MSSTSLRHSAPRAGAPGVANARAAVLQARLQLQGDLTLLRRDLQQATDWRSLARSHPVFSALAIGGAGLLLLRLVRPP